MKDSLGYYAVLEVDYTADIKVIKTQYRDLAKIWHPDSNHSPEAMEHFQKMSVAYNILKDEKTRLVYDLLCEIYSSSDFPDMNNLNILKDKNNRENPLVKIITLQKVIGKIIKYTSDKDKLVCSYEQAKQEVLRYSLINWFLGWWHPKAFVQNIKAIIGNMRDLGNNYQDNLTLLVHNALAYYQENKKQQSLVSAYQALQYADDYQKKLLNQFISLQGGMPKIKIPTWRKSSLLIRQFIVPFLLLLVASYPIVRQLTLAQYMKKENTITYFQKVKLNSGGEFMDDVVVSKIFSVPVDLTDMEKLYHLADDVDIMYGPDHKFDVKSRGQKGQTVRITGFTTDKKWFRIMIDNGEMGFVPAKVLQRGIGTPPEAGSKIMPDSL